MSSPDYPSEPSAQLSTGTPAEPAGTQRSYADLEQHVLDRDQVGASAVYYDLYRAERPLAELLRHAVRIHAPYTHVPYHERIDDGYVNFVNNDHCLLSARATLHLTQLMPAPLRGLPIAQTIWYMPTGLDIWNQKLIKAPGHYARGYEMPPGPPPAPVVHWPDQKPAVTTGATGDYEERIGEWMTHVHRGQVLDAYRVFLGLMEDAGNRDRALAALVFAGLIDVQDRVFLNRSYTTGHKAYRARATVELGRYIGWEDAHDVVYAGALDIAVGPRWYSTYELAGNAVKVLIEDEVIRAVPYAGASETEAALLNNTGTFTPAEVDETIDALIRGREPGNLEQVAKLLKEGKDPRKILEVMQVAAAQVIIETKDPKNFSMPQHCYEYTNTLGWYYDNFEHKQRLKLLFVAASFLNRNADNQRNIGDLVQTRIAAPASASGMSGAQKLAELDRALLALDSDASLAWTQACLDDTEDRRPLVETLAGAAAKLGNDPHNQELGQILIEDFLRTTADDKDRLLLACAQHTSTHQKYGDTLECYHRYCAAMEIEATA
ncbi:MAG: hypothetical protein O7H39_07480 [Gammaproteobacteria bacterium]|nr:hypothetical protein [Gammaproteobacteria bacterium]